MMAWPYLAAIVAGAVLYYLISTTIRRYFIAKRLKHGRKSEEKAFHIIEAYGFKVVDYQQPFDYFMHISGAKQAVRLRPDFIIEKSGKRYICEVKTGEMATDPAMTATRRQLIEYATMIANEGIYLLDADKETLTLVEFRQKSGIAESVFWRNLSIALLAGYAAILIYKLFYP
jgi:hypothetical protein